MQWIWNNQDPNPGFINWIQSKGRIFWIYGKPGAGKSTLMKQIMESKQMVDLLPRKSVPVITVSYFFYELGQPQEKLFGSLLHAIICALLHSFHRRDHSALSNIMRTLKPRSGIYLGDQKRLDRKDDKLKDALRQVLAACQSTAQLFLFIDGMDECEGNRGEQLDFLIAWIESSTKSKLSVRACIASRDELHIRLRLSTYPSLAIHQFTRVSISAYVTRRLRDTWELMSAQPGCTTARFDQDLIDLIVQKAEGVFLWVNLVVTQLSASIEEEAEAKELRRQLRDLPKDLGDLYARIIAKIPDNDVHDAINFLGLYDHNIDLERLSAIPLHVRTLWEFCVADQDSSTAVSCKANFEEVLHQDIQSRRDQCLRMKRRIQRCCKSLIHVEDSDDIHKAKVGLLHRTVMEFIIKDNRFDDLVARADQQLVRDPNISLMAMALRLLKGDSDYRPKWTSWLSPEDNDETSVTESEEKHFSTDDRADIVCFFFSAAEVAQKSDGFSCKPYIDELDRVLSHLRKNWAANYYRTLEEESHTDWNTDVLSLAVVHHIDLYLEEELKINGRSLLHRSQRPLLCYACDHFGFDFSRGTEMVDLLLRNGAGPNEQFYTFPCFTYERRHLTRPWILAVRTAFYDNCGSGQTFRLYAPWI